MSLWLQCVVCGANCIPPEPSGGFWDDTVEVCCECGTINYVVIVDGYDADDCALDHADISTDEQTADVGQPRCDGSCNAMYGEPGMFCRLDCPRADGFAPLVALNVHVEQQS